MHRSYRLCLFRSLSHLELIIDLQAYRILRRREDGGEGSHDRRRSSVERHLGAAPDPIPRGKKRYPKSYRNTDDVCFAHEGPMYEYVTKEKARRTDPDGIRRSISPGYIRTITDDQKRMLGVVYHPEYNRKKLVRAEDIYGSSSSSSRRRY